MAINMETGVDEEAEARGEAEFAERDAWATGAVQDTDMVFDSPEDAYSYFSALVVESRRCDEELCGL